MKELRKPRALDAKNRIVLPKKALEEAGIGKAVRVYYSKSCITLKAE